jgi:hypothetical protein
LAGLAWLYELANAARSGDTWESEWGAEEAVDEAFALYWQ